MYVFLSGDKNMRKLHNHLIPLHLKRKSNTYDSPLTPHVPTDLLLFDSVTRGL
jgi:hypothetical protein